MGEPARRLVGLEPNSQEGPVAVVKATGAEHLIHILKVARSRHVAVDVRTRLPLLFPDEIANCIVVDGRGLNRPPAIDISRRQVTVGAGVDIGHVDRAARQARLCLRGTPAWLGGASVGALLAGGEPGELGLGDGTLLRDLVSALVVSGSGRPMRLGGSDLLGLAPWLGEGLPNALPLLVGGEGRMAILCEVTLHLHSAPFVAWGQVRLPAGRDPLLSALSAARSVITARLVDSVLLDETDDGTLLVVRAATWRGADDRADVCGRTSAAFARHGIEIGSWQDEPKRVRLGLDDGPWPDRNDGALGPSVDLRVQWSDVSAVLDVIEALVAEADPDAPKPVAHRCWALGGEFLRLSVQLGDGRADQHPLIRGVAHIIDAGAVPIGVGSRLREAVRDRMTPSAKVLLTALGRAWDPDGVLSPATGLL